MKIGILTYEKPHRRSQDLIINMAHKYGPANLTVIVLPWREIKAKRPLINTGCLEPLKLTQVELARALGVLYADSEKYGKRPKMWYNDWYVIGGAQLLGEPFTGGNTLNVHPGILYNVRGLDSFKRSLLYDYPLGVSLHIIDERVDAGVLLEERLLQPDCRDSIHSLRQKLYNLEQELLLDAVDIAASSKVLCKDVGKLNPRYHTKRMTYDEECQLIAKRGGFR